MLADKGGSDATRRLGRRGGGAGGEVSVEWGGGRDCALGLGSEIVFGLSMQSDVVGGEADSRNGEPMAGSRIGR